MKHLYQTTAPIAREATKLLFFVELLILKVSAAVPEVVLYCSTYAGYTCDVNNFTLTLLIKEKIYLPTHPPTHLLTPGCRIFLEKLVVTQLVKQQPAFFTEPDDSLPCSEKPATGSYPEPAKSNLPHQSLSP
jgi:hypothetical protein